MLKRMITRSPMKGTRITTMALANKETDSEFNTTDEDEKDSSEERTMS